MNTLDMTSTMATGGIWGTGAGMVFHGLIWLTFLLAVGTAAWLLARAAGRVIINRRQ
jgi:hypothetical protein